jgi:hypothetical protein
MPVDCCAGCVIVRLRGLKERLDVGQEVVRGTIQVMLRITLIGFRNVLDVAKEALLATLRWFVRQ